MVGAGFQTFYVIDNQIGFKFMAGAAAGNGADGGVGFSADILDALGGPKQIGQLTQRNGFLGVDPVTANS